MNTKDRLYYSAKRFFLAFSYVALYWICGVLLRLFIVNSSLVSSAMADGIFIITSFILYFAFGYYKRDKERYHVPLKVSSFGFIFVVFLVVYGATQVLVCGISLILVIWVFLSIRQRLILSVSL